MFISAVYVRFFRSFNFDYLRKAHRDFAPDPWDVLESGGLQYPFVRVGCSATSPPWSAPTSRARVSCSPRSSTRSPVRASNGPTSAATPNSSPSTRRWHFPTSGLSSRILDVEDREALGKTCKAKFDEETDGFTIFRIGGKDPVVYVRQGEEWTKHSIKDKKSRWCP